MTRAGIPASAIVQVREIEAQAGEHAITAVLLAARLRAHGRPVSVSPLPTAYVLWLAGHADQPIREVARGIELASRGQIPAFLARAILKAIAGVPPCHLLRADVEARCRRRVEMAFRLRRRTALRRTALVIAQASPRERALLLGERHGHHERLPLVPRERAQRVRRVDQPALADQRRHPQGDLPALPRGDRVVAQGDGRDDQERAGRAPLAAARADARPVTPAGGAVCDCGACGGKPLLPEGLAVVSPALGAGVVADGRDQDCLTVRIRFADGDEAWVLRSNLTVSEGA